MAEVWDLSDFDQDDEVQQPQKVDKNNPQSLRAYVKQTAKENEDLRKQYSDLQAAVRRDAMASKLAAKNVPEKFAKLIPADVPPDKLDDWLKDYEDLWTKPADSANSADDDEDEETIAEREALSRMSAATGATVPASRPTDLMAQIVDPSQTREGLMKLIEQAGGGYGSG